MDCCGKNKVVNDLKDEWDGLLDHCGLRSPTQNMWTNQITAADFNFSFFYILDHRYATFLRKKKHFYVRRTFFSFMYIMMLRDQDESVEINVERQHFNVKVGKRANSLKC